MVSPNSILPRPGQHGRKEAFLVPECLSILLTNSSRCGPNSTLSSLEQQDSHWARVMREWSRIELHCDEQRFVLSKSTCFEDD